jgi:hypothetical protein
MAMLAGKTDDRYFRAVPKAKRPRQGKDTTSQLYDNSGGGNRYKAAITDRLEKTSDLTAELIRQRIEAVKIQRQQNELLLAKARDELILKDLVEKQAAYLLVSRQRMLTLPQTWSRRILGLSDVREASRILREIVIGALRNLKDLPMKVTDPNWPDTLETEASSLCRGQRQAGEKGF